jgi:hypothetical protein
VRARTLVYLLLASSTFCTLCAGQNSNVTANFGSFYGAGGGTPPTATVFPHITGTFTIQGSTLFNTPNGSVEVPNSISNPTGHATFTINIYFLPNGVDGKFSGSHTFAYSNSNGGQPLNLTVQYSGYNMIPVATAGLKYVVLSILYTPPGNASSSGFSNAVSAGATNGVENDFSSSDSLTFGGGFLGNSNSVTFTTGTTSGNASSFTTSYQASSGAELISVSQAMDHSQDQVFLLIDPSISVTQTGAGAGGTAAGFYSFGPSLDATGKFANGVPPDILNVNIKGLKNPSLIPLEILEPQVITPGTTLPGLSFICAHPLPPSQCTQQNACGCTPQDFAPIVAQDELANTTNQTVQPSSVDPARFVYITNEVLQGPQQSGSGPVTINYSLSDSTMSEHSTSNGTFYGVSYSKTFGFSGAPFTINITATSSFQISQTQTVGESNGTSHTGDLTLGTSDVGCFEHVDIYEDTTYHTFAYALPQAPPANCQ